MDHLPDNVDNLKVQILLQQPARKLDKIASKIRLDKA
jgi:hypothetical protein